MRAAVSAGVLVGAVVGREARVGVVRGDPQVFGGELGTPSLPLQRLAAVYPDTVDAVFRKILRWRDFTWTEHGEALMRRRKE